MWKKVLQGASVVLISFELLIHKLWKKNKLVEVEGLVVMAY